VIVHGDHDRHRWRLGNERPLDPLHHGLSSDVHHGQAGHAAGLGEVVGVGMRHGHDVDADVDVGQSSRRGRRFEDVGVRERRRSSGGVPGEHLRRVADRGGHVSQHRRHRGGVAGIEVVEAAAAGTMLDEPRMPLKVAVKSRVTRQPPGVRVWHEQMRGAGGPRRLEVGDRCEVAGGMVAEVAAPRVAREVPGGAPSLAEQFLVALADDRHDAAGRDVISEQVADAADGLAIGALLRRQMLVLDVVPQILEQVAEVVVTDGELVAERGDVGPQSGNLGLKFRRLGMGGAVAVRHPLGGGGKVAEQIMVCPGAALRMARLRAESPVGVDEGCVDAAVDQVGEREASRLAFAPGGAAGVERRGRRCEAEERGESLGRRGGVVAEAGVVGDDAIRCSSGAQERVGVRGPEEEAHVERQLMPLVERHRDLEWVADAGYDPGGRMGGEPERERAAALVVGPAPWLDGWRIARRRGRGGALPEPDTAEPQALGHRPCARGR